MRYTIKKENAPGFFVYEKSEEEEAEYQLLRTEVMRNIVPCAKMMDEFVTYLVDTLGMVQVPMQESDLRFHNAQFIEKICPEILFTPNIKWPTDRMPDAEERKAIMDNADRRFQEAMHTPLARTGFVFSKYELKYVSHTGKSTFVNVILEENSYTYTAESTAFAGDNEEFDLLHNLIDDIILFRGVTEEDIQIESEWYQTYVAVLTNRANQKRKNIKL